jgi:hypothetical protein
MTKVLKTGGEVDSYCTKCKMILNHRIIALLGTVPANVECSTCRSHHKYRPRMPGERKANAGTSPKRVAAEKAATKAQLTERERVQTWEKAIAGKAPKDFRAYRISEKFDEGDLLRHSKFGDGVVSQVLDAGKVVVLFKDDSRTLAQGIA